MNFQSFDGVRNVAVFSSPLQILNIKSAIDYYQIPVENFLFISLPGVNCENQTRCADMLAGLGWKSLVTIEPKELGPDQSDVAIFSVLSVVEWFLKGISKPVDTVILGDYRPRIFIHILNSLGARRTILVDDGSISHEIAEYRIKSLNPWYQSSGVEKKHRKSGLDFVPNVSFNLAEPEAVEFFSMYRLKVPVADTLTFNPLIFAGPLGNFHFNPCVWLIGSNHVEERITTSRKYFQHVRRILHYYRGRKVQYFAHRRESASKLFDLNKAFGLEIVHTAEGVEAEIRSRGELPASIATIVSTVTDSIQEMFHGAVPVDCFLPELGYYNRKRREHMDAVVAAQRANPRQAARFRALEDRDTKAGFIDRKKFALTEQAYASTCPVRSVPNYFACVWTDDRGFFSSPLDVDITVLSSQEFLISIVDASQPFIMAGDEYFVISHGKLIGEIVIKTVTGLTALAAGRIEGSQIECQIAPKFASADSSADDRRLPTGIPLGHGVAYHTPENLERCGVTMKLEGLILADYGGFIVDPWGKFVRTALRESTENGLHRVTLKIEEFRADEHISIIIGNAGRENICLRARSKGILVREIYFNLTNHQSADSTELENAFDCDIHIDRLYGNWLRFTYSVGETAAVDEIQIILQQKFSDFSSFYRGTDARGILLHSIARGKGKMPCLPSWQIERQSGVLIEYLGIHALKLELSRVDTERKNFFITVQETVYRIILRQYEDLDTGSQISDQVAGELYVENLLGVSTNVMFRVDNSKVVVESSMGAFDFPIDPNPDGSIDIRLLNDQAPENLCPLVFGAEIFRTPIGNVERDKSLYRHEMIPNCMTNQIALSEQG